MAFLSADTWCLVTLSSLMYSKLDMNVFKFISIKSFKLRKPDHILWKLTALRDHKK